MKGKVIVWIQGHFFDWARRIVEVELCKICQSIMMSITASIQ